MGDEGVEGGGTQSRSAVDVLLERRLEESRWVRRAFQRGPNGADAHLAGLHATALRPRAPAAGCGQPADTADTILCVWGVPLGSCRRGAHGPDGAQLYNTKGAAREVHWALPLGGLPKQCPSLHEAMPNRLT